MQTGLPLHTYVVFNWPGTDNVCVLKNSPRGAHAEIKLIKELKKIADEGDLTDDPLVCYANYTPCGDCADKLISFKKKHKMNIEIVAAGPFRVERISCGPTCCRSNPLNEKGLRDLSKYGLKVRGFDGWNDWNDLTALLNEYEGLGKRVLTYSVITKM